MIVTYIWTNNKGKFLQEAFYYPVKPSEVKGIIKKHKQDMKQAGFDLFSVTVSKGEDDVSG